VSQDYVADNAGQGFDFDDDDDSDIESLLLAASKGEDQEDGEEDTSVYFGSSNNDEYSSSKKPAVKPSPPPVREEPKAQGRRAEEKVKEEISYVETESTKDLTDEVDQDEVKVYVTTQTPVKEQEYVRQPRSWEIDPNPTYSTPTPKEVVSPVSIAPTPTPTPSIVSSKSSKIHIPTESDQIALAGKIIRIIDAYRKLSQDVRSVATQFLTPDNEVLEDEAKIVVAVLNVDPMLTLTMRSLCEAKAQDPVERVFYIMGLDDHILHRLGNLVSVFSGTTLNESDTKLNYARLLVRDVEQLESAAINYVESTESILAAAEEENG
jgi:hypothetical protein